jgi:hypothetical protein
MTNQRTPTIEKSAMPTSRIPISQGIKLSPYMVPLARIPLLYTISRII